jgi:2-polyprenyl-6-methoxyphenol hydroxylase-like FAD-dependent oxidoreductase
MTASTQYDIVVVGGGIAGSCLAGVLARGGLGVLLLEREAAFRDRVRGELTFPWGVEEACRAGLDMVQQAAGAVPLRSLTPYEGRVVAEPDWAVPAENTPGLGFIHPHFQEVAFTWAAAQGADTIRPAKATAFARNGRPSVRVVQDGRETEYQARLVVGADGKLSAARRWTGGESMVDPEHHRFGGVLVANGRFAREAINYAWSPGQMVIWLAAGADHMRLYVTKQAAALRASGIDRSFDGLIGLAAERLPEGALANAEQAGPIGFFPNSCTWASELAGNGVVLIGDAAGAPDPSQGHGTSLLFWDVRQLSELLLESTDWNDAILAFAERRRHVYHVIRTIDHWWHIFYDTSDEAMQHMEGHLLAREHDPTVGGLARIEISGPAELVVDEAARRRWFGEDLR